MTTARGRPTAVHDESERSPSSLVHPSVAVNERVELPPEGG